MFVAVALSPPAHADPAPPHGPQSVTATQLATGQFVTPTVGRGAIQQPLNPRLPGYPDFVAGEAVRSQLSPDGTTLAVLCAGQNSLYKPDGTVDTANSTQFIFLYDVSGRHKTSPVLSQVIQQTNAPAWCSLPMAGGCTPPAAAMTRCTSTPRPVAAGRGARRSPWATTAPVSAWG
jgi:hypothetical protein